MKRTRRPLHSTTKINVDLRRDPESYKDLNEIGRVQLRRDLRDPRNLEARKESIEIQLGLSSAHKRVLHQINAGTTVGLDWDTNIQNLQDLGLVRTERKKWTDYIRDNR